MANSADPDQLASSDANWSGPILFAMAGYILVQQDKGNQLKSETAFTGSLPFIYGGVLWAEQTAEISI